MAAPAQHHHHPVAAASGEVVVAIAAMITRDGVTSRLRIAKHALDPLMAALQRQIAAAPAQHHRLLHPVAAASLEVVVAIVAMMARDGVTSRRQIAKCAPESSMEALPRQIAAKVSAQTMFTLLSWCHCFSAWFKSRFHDVQHLASRLTIHFT